MFNSNTQRGQARSSKLFSPSFGDTFRWVLVLALLIATENVFGQSIRPGVVEEFEGELEILHEDSDRGSRYFYFLKSAKERFSLSFSKDVPTHLTSGAKVRVRGVRNNNVLALESDRNDSVQVLSSVLPN